jgi:hypothetical protein
MLEGKRCHTHHQFFFQRINKNTWIVEKHTFGQGHQIRRKFLEDSMEEVGD